MTSRVRAALGGRGSRIGAHRRAGDAARDRRDWPAAIEHYRLHLAELPTDFAIWVQLGHGLKELRDFGGAAEAYQRAELLDPADADLLLNLGHLMKAQGRLNDATEHYRRSAALGNNAARSELDASDTAADAGGSGVSSIPDATAAAAEAASRGVRFVGAIDLVDGVEVRGWAFDPEAPNDPTEVELVTDHGRVIGRAVTNRLRPDVAAAGFGQGLAGFTIFADGDGLAGRTVSAEVRLVAGSDRLDGSPARIAFPPSAPLIPEDRVTNARYVVAKPLEWVEGEHALFVAYAPTGMLQPFVRSYLGMLRDAGIAVTLVVNADRPVLLDDSFLSLVACAIVRENRGYDFGAWAHALQIEPRLYGADALYIINDSVFGPRDAAAFASVVARVRASKADFIGLTETLERGWHIQSYFMVIKRELLASYAFQFFVNDIRILVDKDRIIDTYEVPLARRVRDAGFEAEALFPVDEARNPTLFAWRTLLANEFPFAKLLLLRGGFPHIDTVGMRKALRAAGFDMDMIDATLRYGTDEAPPGGLFPLLAKPPLTDALEPLVPSKPYKVAFYGPWNFDNGLGSASRGIIGAIRQTGVRLNLHPIKKAFHVHRLLTPPHDIVDFDGPADIAIVHLNPDSWHLLTDEQLREVRLATKRIGYWVWEMDHLPPLWRREFSSVDRIWAPSGYCANLFAAQDEAPVDVVPHAVPVDHSTRQIDRARVLGDLGLAADARVILYVFDGSSYLVRKNPAALVRAFGASGLADSGWTLVLKTKHLMDRVEEGAAFAAMADGTEGVLLVDRSLAPGELRDLVVAADIYASPHCSEGFGLTVAEAMAAGKVVVATDFSGTREFLDASCGYPVDADSWTLDEDYGHYTKGGVWAKIDERALSDALVRAAAGIVAGDTSVGDAARDRIRANLSYDTVGKAIGRSFDALFTDTKPVRRAPARIDAAGVGGVPVDRTFFEDVLPILPLKAGSFEPVAADALLRVADDRDAWLMLVPEDARVHPLTHRILARHAAARPDASIFYADDVALGAPSLLDQVRLKPEFDQTLFAAQDYIGAPLFVRGAALHALGGLDPAAGAAALYDLMLRALEQGHSIARIPEILAAFPDDRPSTPVNARRALLARSPLYADFAIADGLTDDTLQLVPSFARGKPSVTLCVPTRRTPVADGEGSYIERFLDSIATVDWPADRLTVLVGDDVVGEPDWAKRAWPFALERIETPRAEGEAFNYSSKMNRLWRAADGDVIVFMNDDVVARDTNWLAALVGFAVDGGVGGVGARLLYDDGTVQHAGMVGGILGTSVHAWLGRRAGARTYQDWAVVQREWSMVTGAVFATRRGVLEEIGGFDQGFSLEFNDVDLCLKIRTAGYRIVYTPFAEMTHSEKASRAASIPPGEQVARFLSRWSGWLQDDPAIHPKMRRDLIDLAPAVTKDDWYM